MEQRCHSCGIPKRLRRLEMKTKPCTYSDFTGTSAGIWRLTYGTTIPFLWSSPMVKTMRNENEQRVLTPTLQVPQRGSGASRMERRCHSCRIPRWSRRLEMKTNTVHLLRLYRDLSRDLAFDIWNDDAIPARTIVSTAPMAWTSQEGTHSDLTGTSAGIWRLAYGLIIPLLFGGI